MFANECKVLLILPQDLRDHARVVAGKAMASLKLPVSLQIVLRALVQEGLKRDGDRNLLANVEAQAREVRRSRSLAGKGRTTEGSSRTLGPPLLRRPSESQRQRGEQGGRFGGAGLQEEDSVPLRALRGTRSAGTR